MRFVDSSIFIKWGRSTVSEALQDAEVSLCGYILSKIKDGEETMTSSLVKDEVLIWFSRYQASRLEDFIRSLIALTHIEVVYPTLEDELEATRLYAKYPLGISDLINYSIMKRYDIHEIYSTDKGLDKVPEVKRVFEELKDEPQYHDFIAELGRRGHGLHNPRNRSTPD